MILSRRRFWGYAAPAIVLAPSLMRVSSAFLLPPPELVLRVTTAPFTMDISARIWTRRVIDGVVQKNSFIVSLNEPAKMAAGTIVEAIVYFTQQAAGGINDLA